MATLPLRHCSNRGAFIIVIVLKHYDEDWQRQWCHCGAAVIIQGNDNNEDLLWQYQ